MPRVILPARRARRVPGALPSLLLGASLLAAVVPGAAAWAQEHTKRDSDVRVRVRTDAGRTWLGTLVTVYDDQVRLTRQGNYDMAFDIGGVQRIQTLADGPAPKMSYVRGAVAGAPIGVLAGLYYYGKLWAEAAPRCDPMPAPDCLAQRRATRATNARNYDRARIYGATAGLVLGAMMNRVREGERWRTVRLDARLGLEGGAHGGVVVRIPTPAPR